MLIALQDLGQVLGQDGVTQYLVPYLLTVLLSVVTLFLDLLFEGGFGTQNLHRLTTDEPVSDFLLNQGVNERFEGLSELGQSSHSECWLVAIKDQYYGESLDLVGDLWLSAFPELTLLENGLVFRRDLLRLY